MNYLCTLFKGLDGNLVVKSNDPEYYRKNFLSLNTYCPVFNNGKDQECSNYEEIISSVFIILLTNLKSSVENDKLAQYAILWLCYEINKNKNNGISNLNEFYNKYINGIKKYVEGTAGAGNYNSCMNIINKKEDLMNMDIQIASNIYKAFEKLCKLYTECNEKNNNYLSCSKDAQDFANEFKKLNDDPTIAGNNSYIEILYTLSTDYNDFKNNCAKKCSKCIDIPTLTNIKVPQSSGVTSPSSPIASKLIPVLLISSIPILLGIAYKYSLFGFDKLFQRQHLRNKLKKIKKKMELNI
ncbi:Plasmodium variant antigen protein Cir/Yir/Bir, putative [Plasmodium chabaudi adami]|uniref:Plasmodium variant antigen protein Cir/Yir/Bir, putative n=1 Tax=Plasmodium chabaudi adami TaxID=5826 RepID=A0A1D3LC02_PLACE|nr:Plasmodium variant antigen protein Cir/Yir/Bir, putative [Plasmodium chabaudi adami]